MMLDGTLDKNINRPKMKTREEAMGDLGLKGFLPQTCLEVPWYYDELRRQIKKEAKFLAEMKKPHYKKRIIYPFG